MLHGRAVFLSSAVILICRSRFNKASSWYMGWKTATDGGPSASNLQNDNIQVHDGRNPDGHLYLSGHLKSIEYAQGRILHDALGWRTGVQ